MDRGGRDREGEGRGAPEDVRQSDGGEGEGARQAARAGGAGAQFNRETFCLEFCLEKPFEFWLEKPLEFWLEIPYTTKS